WGSKRSGPDLARVGGKYSDAWHKQHLIDPRSVVPESIMPPYAFLEGRKIDAQDAEGWLKANRAVGVPYTDEMIEMAASDFATQTDPFADDFDGFMARYPKAVVRDFDGDPRHVTEMDALIAYLQVLGTMVDFETYEPEENYR